MKKIAALVILISMVVAATAYAASIVILAWDASTDASVTGYKVYWGTASRNYPNVYNAQKNLAFQILNLPDTGPFYFAVTAYNTDQESDFSVELVAFTAKATAGTNGKISPVGNMVLAMGSTQVFSITPNSGYVIKDVLVDGVSVGAVQEYTFASIITNHTISATFRPAPPTRLRIEKGAM